MIYPDPRNRLPMLRPVRVATFGLALLLSTSCSSTETQADTSAPAADAAQNAASEPAPSGQGALAATSQPMPQPSARSAAAKAADAAAANRDLRAISPAELSELTAAAREHAALVDERTRVLVEGFIDQGVVALQAGDIDGAHKHFANAYELDPGNPLAREYYNRTGPMVGDSSATVAAMADSMRGLAEVRAQQQQVLVDGRLEAGQKAMAAGEHDQAIRNFEDALALLRFQPGGADREADVVALLASARYEKNRAAEARDAELAARVMEAQEQADFVERNRIQLTIEGLLRSADDAFLRDDYDTAIANLDEVISLDARHDIAASRRRIAFKAKNEAEARRIREAYRDQWIKTFEDLERDTIVPNDIMSFPDREGWAETVAQGPKSFGAAGVLSAQDLAVTDSLNETRIPVNFDGNTLDEVIEHLTQVAGVNFLLSQDAQDVAPDESYTLLDRNPQSIGRILKILLEDLSLTPMTYVVRDGIVRIQTTDEARGDYILEFYDVRDITFVAVDHASQDFNLLPSGTDAESFNETVDETEPLPVSSADTLLSLIQDNIQPDTWTDDSNRTISAMEGTLVVKTTADVHEQIRQLMSDLRRNTNTLVNIETRFIEVEDSFLEDIGVDLRGLDAATGGSLEDFGQPNVGGVGTPNNPQGIGTGIDSGAFYSGSNGDIKGRTEHLFDTVLGEPDVLTGGGGISLEALFLDDTNVNAVLRAVRKYQNSNIVNAPSLTLRSGQRGNITVLTNLTYVRDFEPEIAQAAVIAQPELDVVKEGIVLDVRAVASADRRFITLELRPTVAELVPDENGDRLPEELVSLGTPNANNVTLHLPELKVQRLRTTATIPDGATLMLGGLKTSIERDQTTETPFLADIPLIGALFRHKGEYTSKRKLLILLTASIIAPEEHEPAPAPLR